MTPAQTKLRELRARQSRERGRVAALAVADALTDQTRAELDTIETGTPDLERQIRAATSAVDTEETEQRDAAVTDNKDGLDTEDRERLELRSKVRMSNYIVAAVEQRAADGPELEYNAAIGITGNRFPLELLAPPEQRAAHTENARPPMLTWLPRHAGGSTGSLPRPLLWNLESRLSQYPWAAPPIP